MFLFLNVQIIENVGGRLLLRYDTPDSSAPEFWLHFTSPRIFPMGWSAEKGTKMLSSLSQKELNCSIEAFFSYLTKQFL